MLFKCVLLLLTASAIVSKDAPEGIAPHQVSIKPLIGGHRCGASIIDPQWIITAAHCASGCDRGCKIEYGSNKLGRGRISYVSETVIYPGALRDNYIKRNDIALMKLTDNIKLSKNAKPIKLNKKEVQLGDEGFITGFSYIDSPKRVKTLQMANVTTVECTMDPSKYYHFFCIRADESAPCSGDSGGPLVIDGTLAGITSYGNMDCVPGRLNYYTDVSKYTKWIKKVLRSN